MFIQIVIGGIAVGSLYALTALGLVLIYKTSDIVNFAQGEMAMVTTFVSFTLMTVAGIPFFASFFLALIFATLFGMSVERVFMRPVQKAPILSQIILTLGLYMSFRGIAGMIWGYNPSAYPEALTGEILSFGAVMLTPHQILIFAVTLALMVAFYLLFKHTLIGLAMRAASQNIMTAELMGIRVGSIFSWTWGISAILGGVAGMFIAPITFLDPNMMGEVTIKAFAAAVLGGFTSLPGAIMGGLLIGILENVVATYISSELKTAFVFLLIIVVLYIKPSGLLGIKVEKKV